MEKEELRQMEPNISDDAVAALYAPTAGIVCPFGMNIAFAENADGQILYVFAGFLDHLIQPFSGGVASLFVLCIHGCSWKKIRHLTGQEKES